MKNAKLSIQILGLFSISLLFFSCEKDTQQESLIGTWTISEIQADVFFKENGTVIDLENEVGNLGTVQFSSNQQGTLTFEPDLFNNLSSDDMPYLTNFTWSETNKAVTLETPEGTYLWNIIERDPDTYRFFWYLNDNVSNGIEGIEYLFRITKTE